MKYLFHRQTLLATLFITTVLAIIYLNPLHLHLWEPAERALEDFDYTDLAFSHARLRAAPIDTNIVIINIGHATHKEIDSTITAASAQSPAAIGLDVIFGSAQSDSSADAHLLQTISATPGLVMATRLEAGTGPALYNAPAKAAAHRAYTNYKAVASDVVRYFQPFIKKPSEEEDTSFTVALLRLYRPAKFRHFLKKYRRHEIIINYRRDSTGYTCYQYAELLHDGGLAPDALKGKLVLVGFYSSNPNDIEDRHLTPTNPRVFGRTLPDMNGILINANILSMMLEEQYIYQSPKWLSVLAGFVLIWLFIGLFMRYLIAKHIWFHVIVKGIELCLLTLLVLCSLALFTACHYKIDLTIALWGIPLAAEVFYFYEALGEWLHHRRHTALTPSKKPHRK